MTVVSTTLWLVIASHLSGGPNGYFAVSSDLLYKFCFLMLVLFTLLTFSLRCQAVLRNMFKFMRRDFYFRAFR